MHEFTAQVTVRLQRPQAEADLDISVISSYARHLNHVLGLPVAQRVTLALQTFQHTRLFGDEVRHLTPQLIAMTIAGE